MARRDIARCPFPNKRSITTRGRRGEQRGNNRRTELQSLRKSCAEGGSLSAARNPAAGRNVVRAPFLPLSTQPAIWRQRCAANGRPHRADDRQKAQGNRL